MKGLKSNQKWDTVAGQLKQLTHRIVDDKKVTDHPALLPTGVKPLLFVKEETTIYDMIVGRMPETFSDKCIKDVATVKVECAGTEFVTKGNVVRQTGWQSVYREESEDTILQE